VLCHRGISLVLFHLRCLLVSSTPCPFQAFGYGSDEPQFPKPECFNGFGSNQSAD